MLRWKKCGRIKQIYEKDLNNLDSLYATLTNYPAAGKIIKKEDNINYVADGENNVIPVPDGFEYKEGSKSTGFVIIDVSKNIDESKTRNNR